MRLSKFSLACLIGSVFIVAVVFVGLLSGCGAMLPASEAVSTMATLDGLAVKGRAPMTGYDREKFGPAWADVDRNGCDTRNDILKRDLEDETFKPQSKCIVLTGHFIEPYTGQPVTFQRGPMSGLVQIDHVVAIGDAWQTGAQSWTPERRKEFANDPLELLAVSGKENQEKGIADAATWLVPRNKGFRCAYVTRQVTIKAKYGLWVKPAEKAAMEKVLATCP